MVNDLAAAAGRPGVDLGRRLQGRWGGGGGKRRRESEGGVMRLGRDMMRGRTSTL